MTSTVRSLGARFSRSWALASSRLRSEILRKDVELFQHRCDSLVSRFESADSPEEKTRIADQYSRALNQLETSALLLELVERLERENRS
jgi:hypothetical protein